MVSDAGLCANVSAEILRRNGSAVDAAITAMLCNGVVQPESSGLGGGGFMLVHLSNGSTYAINFRETAPMAATEDMFHSDPSLAEKVRVLMLSGVCALCGIYRPGAVAGEVVI